MAQNYCMECGARLAPSAAYCHRCGMQAGRTMRDLSKAAKLERGAEKAWAAARVAAVQARKHATKRNAQRAARATRKAYEKAKRAKRWFDKNVARIQK